jgi:hypothetical protein
MEEKEIPMSASPVSNEALRRLDGDGPKNRKRPFKKFLRMLFVLCLLTIGIWILLGSVFSYSEGFREGYVYKFSHKGVLFKTWEGTLKTGFINFNNSATPNEEWLFSVKDPEVVETINKMGERALLKLYYKQYFAKLFWRGKTKYFVTKVEMLK